jgi:hypothetical protein
MSGVASSVRLPASSGPVEVAGLVGEALGAGRAFFVLGHPSFLR